MKKIAFGLAALVAACAPQPGQQAVSVVSDAVLVKQVSHAGSGGALPDADAAQILSIGAWSCHALASGINIDTRTTYKPAGLIDSNMHLAMEGMDLNVTLHGVWVLKDATLQQRFSDVGQFTGTLNGKPVTSSESAELGKAIQEMSPDPETISISTQKFTLTDGEGTVTSCVR